jgi:hypothetical protein
MAFLQFWPNRILQPIKIATYKLGRKLLYGFKNLFCAYRESIMIFENKFMSLENQYKGSSAESNETRGRFENCYNYGSIIQYTTNRSEYNN